MKNNLVHFLKTAADAGNLAKDTAWTVSAGASSANTANTLANTLKLQRLGELTSATGKASGPIAGGFLGYDALEMLARRPGAAWRPTKPLANAAEWGARARQETALRGDESLGGQLAAQWRGAKSGSMRPFATMGAATEDVVGTGADIVSATRKAGIADFLRFMVHKTTRPK
jgi:hypothetical protein